mgnify:CR=1 FL=1
MNNDLQLCFDTFAGYDICIVGSAVRDFETAHDIDILFLSGDFPSICRQLRVKYCGWDTPTHHVRKAVFRILGVGKPIHLLSWGSYDPGHCQLLRDGSYRHPGKFFDKETGMVRVYRPGQEDR